MDGVLRVDLDDARDASGARRLAFRSALREGLVETGFVRVVGHGVGAPLVERAHEGFERFFAQDEAAKLRAGGVEGGQRGFTPFGVEHARDSRAPDQKEFFHVGQVPDPTSPLADLYPANVWPADMPDLEPAAMALYRALERAAYELLVEIARAFDLRDDTFASMIGDGNSILRAAHYPPVAAGAPPVAVGAPPVAAGAPPVVAGAGGGVMRAAPHEDINLITLLCNATDEGLELLTRSGDWIAVECRPGEIIADVGDMLARITNERLPATTHRVVARGEAARRHRYALPFFAHPRPECDLSVLPDFVEAGERPRFAPITAAAFLDERLREIGLIP